MNITLKRSEYDIKICKVGFSWTIFFFGIFPLFFRGMVVQAFIVILTFGIANLYYMFAGNGVYINRLMSEGYVPADEYSKLIVARIG